MTFKENYLVALWNNKGHSNLIIDFELINTLNIVAIAYEISTYFLCKVITFAIHCQQTEFPGLINIATLS